MARKIAASVRTTSKEMAVNLPHFAALRKLEEIDLLTDKESLSRSWFEFWSMSKIFELNVGKKQELEIEIRALKNPAVAGLFLVCLSKKDSLCTRLSC